jgi:hypothetical protein
MRQVLVAPAMFPQQRLLPRRRSERARRLKFAALPLAGRLRQQFRPDERYGGNDRSVRRVIPKSQRSRHGRQSRPAPRASAYNPGCDAPHAPFIFYEIAPAFGFTNGVVNITLSANRTWAGPDGVVNEQVVVAYLRGNIQPALSLRHLG